MRGLKYPEGLGSLRAVASHPAWDAWIEILFILTKGLLQEVASRMGCVD